MLISGKIGNAESVRPLEVTIINHSDVVPWRYLPRNLPMLNGSEVILIKGKSRTNP